MKHNATYVKKFKRCCEIPSEFSRVQPVPEAKSCSLLPDNPGIYIFIDEEGYIAYVGKSTNLRSRVVKNHPRYRQLKYATVTYVATDGHPGLFFSECYYIGVLKPWLNVVRVTSPLTRVEELENEEEVLKTYELEL